MILKKCVPLISTIKVDLVQISLNGINDYSRPSVPQYLQEWVPEPSTDSKIWGCSDPLLK